MTSLDDHRRSYAAFAASQFTRWTNRIAVAGLVVIVLAVFGIVGSIDRRIEEETRSTAARMEQKERLAVERQGVEIG